jgi:hypothetical protein
MPAKKAAKKAGKPAYGTHRPEPPPPDFSGVVFGHPSAGHLSGVLIHHKGTDLVVTARHLYPQSGQKVMIAGQPYTLDVVRGIDVAVTGAKPSSDWKEDRLHNGDLLVATLKETVPAEVTRYPIAEMKSGTGQMLHANGKVSVFKFGPHTSFRQWLKGVGTTDRHFIGGDSGRPILHVDKSGRTLLVSVLSRQWWGEWLLLKREHLD